MSDLVGNPEDRFSHNERLILSSGRNDSMDTLLKNEVLSQNYCVNVLCVLLIICGLLTFNIRACHCSGVAEIMRYI